MAEGLVRELLAGRGEQVELSSAGIVGWEGSPAVDEAVLAAAELGADISGHRARRLEPHHVEDADLIVCMADEHRESVLRLVPDAEDRTFGLKELGRLVAELSPPGSGSAFRDRVRAANELRRSGGAPSHPDEDVADPIGLSLDAFRAVAADIEEWSRRMAAGLFPAGAGAERQSAGT
jgi:protein-tyrosine-phosphatase